MTASREWEDGGVRWEGGGCECDRRVRLFSTNLIVRLYIVSEC